MTLLRRAALGIIVGGTLVGTWTHGQPPIERRAGDTILAADFHVHGYPIDGTLPRWELQRDAARRGLDAIAVTNHNQTIAGRFGGWFSGADVIAIAAGADDARVSHHCRRDQPDDRLAAARGRGHRRDSPAGWRRHRGASGAPLVAQTR